MKVTVIHPFCPFYSLIHAPFRSKSYEPNHYRWSCRPRCSVISDEVSLLPAGSFVAGT